MVNFFFFLTFFFFFFKKPSKIDNSKIKEEQVPEVEMNISYLENFDRVQIFFTNHRITQ